MTSPKLPPNHLSFWKESTSTDSRNGIFFAARVQLGIWPPVGVNLGTLDLAIAALGLRASNVTSYNHVVSK